MWDCCSGYGWGMMLGGSLMMLFFGSGLALLIVLIVRGSAARDRSTPHPKRFAAD